MVDGAIHDFPYGAGIALVNNLLDEWRRFDGMCALKGVNLKELPSRRMISVIMVMMEEGRDQESLEKLHSELRRCAQIPHPILRPKKPKLVLLNKDKPAEEKQPNTDVVRPKKWRAPEGWTPPGWDETQSYLAAKSFMKFQGNPK